MNIALYHYLPAGGAKIAAFEQVRRLSRRHTISLYTLGPDQGEYALTRFCQSTTVIPVPKTEKSSGIRRLTADLFDVVWLPRFDRRLARRINRGNYDVVLVYGNHRTHSPYLLRWLTHPSVYVCFEPLRMVYEKSLAIDPSLPWLNRGYETINRRIRKRLDYVNTRAATKVVTSSLYAKEYIQQVYGVDALVCPLGVDANFFSPGKERSKTKLLFIGQRTAIDGFDLLQKALKKLSPAFQKRLLIFDSPKHQLAHKKATIRQAYRRSALSLSLARLEPFGLIPLESMACETPVLAINEGGYRETIISGQTGLLVKPNPSALASALRRVLTNDQQLQKWGIAGRKNVTAHWTWNQSATTLEKMLKRAADRHKQ